MPFDWNCLATIRIYACKQALHWRFRVSVLRSAWHAPWQAEGCKFEEGALRFDYDIDFLNLALDYYTAVGVRAALMSYRAKYH